MFNGKYTTLNRVLENISRDTEYEEELYKDDATEWAVRAMNLIGVDVIDETVVLKTAVENFRCAIPSDVKEIKGIRNYKTKESLGITSDIYTISLTDQDISKIEIVGGTNISSTILPTYKVVNGYIFFNFEEGDIEIVYTKYKLDANGCLMIPDVDRYLMAIEAYIIYKVDSKLYRRGKIPRDIKFESEQNWLWYVNSAANKLITPNYDEAEFLNKRAQSMRPDIDGHSNGFGTINNPTIKRF